MARVIGDEAPTLLLRKTTVDAVVFDMDGVVTQTATVHAAAWKTLFDAYLAAAEGGAASSKSREYRRFRAPSP